MANDACSIAGCEGPHYARGLCNKHYQVARSRGELRPLTADERYEAKVDRSAGADACHPWVGCVSDRGQAKFAHDGETLAVRWAYKRYVGPLGDGEVVRHTCDVGICCNERHWVKGTQADNVRDCIERGRQARGTKIARSTTTEDQVRQIRDLRGDRLTDIAAAVGVSRNVVTSVLSGRTWGHVRG